MKIRATTNQLGLAPMRIPKTRASWIDPVPIHTHGGRRPQARAPSADSWVMRLPSPRSMPRLGNVRLSVKRGLCFGATELVSGTVDKAADGVTTAIGAYIERADRERAGADKRFASAKAGAKRDTLIIGALALLVALALAFTLARHLTRRLAALSRAAEALAEGDVDHELAVKGGDE